MTARLAKPIVALAFGAYLLFPTAAVAKVPIYSLSLAGSSTQAGGHPDVALIAEIGASGTTEPATVPCLCNTLRDLKVNTPAGLIAAPGNIPQCTAAEFAAVQCPVDTQLGLAVIRFFPDDQGGFYWFMPIYNMVARPDELALLAFPSPNTQTPIYNDVTSRTEGDYGLEFKTFGIANILPPNQIATIFWGVPAASSHDALRFPFGGGPFGQEGKTTTVSCGPSGISPIPNLLAGKWGCGPPPPPVAANSPIVPFVQNPTACLGELSSSADTFAYDLESDHLDSTYPAVTGCDQLSFSPTLAAKPTTTEADSPSGLDVDLTVPQDLSPDTPTDSAIRDVKITLPQGFTVNPNAADGKTSCTDAEARFGTREAAQCPEFSKIGTMEVTSTQFPTVLRGALYLGEPKPGNRYRIFQVFDGFGQHVKLAGTVSLDPSTGQSVTTFTDLPQQNFQDFKLHFFGSEKGLLATPTQCGTYAVDSEFTPWAYPSIPKQTSTQFFTIGSGPGGSACPPAQRPFNPSFSGGVANNTAGVHSSFTVDLNRPDGDQYLTGLNVKTPPGFSASLKGIPYCPQAAIDQLQNSLYTGLAEIASPSCPAASQVGTVVAGAGAGSKPLYVGGRVYLAGPYRSAPLSLVVVIPAVSGPYDLGNVATRVALNVDPITVQVTAVSDPLPQILEGIPLRTRFIRVSLDRPNFAINPTNCDPLSLDATASGNQGATANLSTHFQVANCSILGYGPKLSIALKGSSTKRNGHPALHATFVPKADDANTKQVVVTLPPTMQLDSFHIGTACTKAQLAADQCPAKSLIGTASATSPLLDNPLKGNVYLVSAGNTLPDLVMALRGQFSIDLHGVIDTAPSGGLRNSFKVVPDVPVTSFTLDLAGGKKGLIVYNTDVCAHPKPALAQMDGQNGAISDRNVALQTACGKARHKRHPRHKRHHHVNRTRRAGR